MELLLDPSAPSLTAWLLDAEAAGPLRSAQAALEVRLVVDGAPQTVRLDAVARALTGETVGDTSEFRATDPLLANARLEGTIARVEVLGAVFEDVALEAEER